MPAASESARFTQTAEGLSITSAAESWSRIHRQEDICYSKYSDRLKSTEASFVLSDKRRRSLVRAFLPVLLYFCFHSTVTAEGVWVQVLLPVSSTLRNDKSTNCAQRSSIILCGVLFQLSLPLPKHYPAEGAFHCWMSTSPAQHREVNTYNNLFNSL